MGIDESEERRFAGWRTVSCRILACIACVHLLASGTLAGDATKSSRSPRAARQGSPELQLAERLAGICDAFRASSDVPGLSVGVSIGGEIVFARGFGFADLENQVPATSQTVYRIGSITKQFTAALILKLCEQGKLDLEMPLSSLLPDYPPTSEPILLTQLLTHTSGIPNYTVLGGDFERCMGVELPHSEIRAMFQSKPLDFPPGRGFAYSNSGYFLLGEILERLTRRSYAELIAQELTGPLELSSTYYGAEETIIPRRAQGYRKVDGKLLNDLPLGVSQSFAGSGLCSSVIDLLHWTAALTGGRVLHPESYLRMVQPTTLHDGRDMLYGFGVWLTPFDGHASVRHNGTVNGFRSELAWYPSDGVAIAVLSNSENAPVEKLEERIARLMLGSSPPTDANRNASTPANPHGNR